MMNISINWAHNQPIAIIDWTTIPDWIRWIAIDKSGEVYGFEHPPQVDTSPGNRRWIEISQTESRQERLGVLYDSNIQQMWTSCLFIRPSSIELNKKRALISVSNKKNLNVLAPFLVEQDFDIFSTGGTLKYLKQHRILKVKDVSNYTKFPEMMDGRLKTLHPLVHGGLLGRRGVDDHIMAEHGILPFDLVVVNLYDFEGAISKPGIQLNEAIEQIDIGGPAMLRSAAKNYKDVTVLCDPEDYIDYMSLASHNNLTETVRLKYAQKVFAHTTKYDDTISKYLYHNLFK